MFWWRQTQRKDNIEGGRTLKTLEVLAAKVLPRWTQFPLKNLRLSREIYYPNCVDYLLILPSFRFRCLINLVDTNVSHWCFWGQMMRQEAIGCAESNWRVKDQLPGTNAAPKFQLYHLCINKAFAFYTYRANDASAAMSWYRQPAQHLSSSSYIFASTKPLPSIHTAPMMPPLPCHGIPKIHAMLKEVMGIVEHDM